MKGKIALLVLLAGLFGLVLLVRQKEDPNLQAVTNIRQALISLTPPAAIHDRVANTGLEQVTGWVEAEGQRYDLQFTADVGAGDMPLTISHFTGTDMVVLKCSRLGTLQRGHVVGASRTISKQWAQGEGRLHNLETAYHEQLSSWLQKISAAIDADKGGSR